MASLTGHERPRAEGSAQPTTRYVNPSESRGRCAYELEDLTFREFKHFYLVEDQARNNHHPAGATTSKDMPLIRYL